MSRTPSFVLTLVPGRTAGILQVLWDYICGSGVRERRKSCEGKHGTRGCFIVFQICTRFYFFSLRSLLIQCKLYLSKWS